MDWVDPKASDSAKEWEDDMSSLTVGFVTRMHKRAASAQRETTPGSEVSSEKRLKRSSPDEEAQRSPVVIVVNSLEQASNALLALEGAAQDASREACASLKDGVPVGGPRNVDRVVREAPLEVVVGPFFPARLVNVSPLRLVLNLPINPMMRDQPSTDTSVLSSNVSQSIIDRWNPFNQRDTSVANMRDL